MTSSSFQDSAAPERNAKAEQILAGARQVFLEHGFAAATTDMVQRAAGVSKSTVYAHFPGKDALFAAVIGAECQKLADRTRAERIKGKTVRETLIRIGTNLLETALSPPVIALYRIIVAEAARVPEAGAVLSDAGKHMQHEVAAYLTEADRRGDIRVSDPGAAASDFEALVLHDIQKRCLLGTRVPPKASQIRKIVDAAVDVFLRAYAPR
jgi:TetR/AcrR family transcriptional regulator, mexJK operon transcriptional repressor